MEFPEFVQSDPSCSEFETEGELYIEEARQPRRKLPTSGAQRLSRNRAAKRATMDATSGSHARTLYHMNRRVAEMWRDAGLLPREPPYSVGSVPATATGGSGRTSSRPCSAPQWGRVFEPQPPPSPPPRAATPTSRGVGSAAIPSYLERRVKHSAQALRTAILNEIIERRVYEEAKLKQLLRSYLQLNTDQAFYPTLIGVVDQLRADLDLL